MSRISQTVGRDKKRVRGRNLARMSDDDLLDTRMCELNVKLQGSIMEDRIEKLYAELEERDIRLLPHIWTSSEWFSPDGVPGIAIPFYLLHDRLMKLERKMMLEVEGSTERQCMQILRHEAGHAICIGYRLHYKKRWRAVFGHFSTPYPVTYRPDPLSRHYVLHFDSWYAQAHPAEDFAETFAVWLKPQAKWRKQYNGWPALQKLECVNELMSDISGTIPPVRSRRHVEPLSHIKTTLRQHYKGKQRRYADDWPDFYDRDLNRIFSDKPKYKRNETAAAFLHRNQPQIRNAVSTWTGEYQYTVDQVLRDMIDRCKELKLRVAQSQRETTTQTMLMVTVQTMNFLNGGHYRFAL